MSSSAQASDGSDSGHNIGPYTLTKEIGKGSFAVVFQAKLRQSDTGKVASSHATPPPSSKVAIKVVTRKKLTTKLLENLEGEISILRTARHANIVELIDCLKTSSHIYLVMQYCRMGDLSNYIRTRRRPSGKEGQQRKSDPVEEEAEAQYPNPHDGGLNSQVARSFLTQLAAAMKFMRGKNIVHRDIKPQNLLLQEPEADLVASGHPYLIPQVKVADFGFARHLEAASLAETLCGSPLYMAPEILRYEKYDAKADLWSVGAVLYEMCVGKPPFRAANHVELLRRIEKGEDRIKFPDERSDESLRREHSRRVEDGKGDEGEMIRPHFVDEDLKGLIRSLLKRKPVERITFESFFSCDVIENGQRRIFKSLRLSSSSLSNSTTPVATRIAPSIPSSRHSSSTEVTRQDSAPEVAKIEHQSAVSTAPTQIPIVKATPQTYFKSKYVVGGRKAASSSPAPTTQRQDSRTPSNIYQDHPSEAGEASSLEDNVLETPESSVTHLPATAVPEDGTLAAGPTSNRYPTPKTIDRVQKSVMEDEDKGYVMVEKRNVEVNALADAMADANLTKTTQEQRGPWGALGVVRRPSRLGRLTSGQEGTGATSSTNPTSPTSAISFSTSPRYQVSPAAVSASRLASTPPNAPFVIPIGSRRPSFQRRSSHTNEAANLSRFSASSQQVALVPSSAPSAPSGSSASPVFQSSPNQPIGVASPTNSSALGRAISMASIRLFGVPTGMSLRSASVRRSLRLGLGGGMTFLSSSPGHNAIDYQNGDPTEQNLLNLLHDYGQKSFVLSEFADSKLSVYFGEGPHQGNYDEGGRQGNSSGSSMSSVNLSSLHRFNNASPTVPQTIVINSKNVHSSEVIAAEALILYVKSLSFLQRGIDATKDYIEARSTSYTGPYQASVEVNDAVQWLRAKFNDGFERANFARSKASQEIPDSAQNVDKMIFDKALEIAKGAALDEMGSNRTTSNNNNDQQSSWNAESCLLAYETASNLLMALLDPGEEAMELSDGSVGTIEMFVKSIQKRMANLQRRYEAALTPP
ncbi:hypothetical protein CBS101457_001834 [Exobasidium rhododendri]|nr:hypothetical protein CBS101457_001834 [Exobasidium rhododendri]